jgi:anti-sigma B factor antagonist
MVLEDDEPGGRTVLRISGTVKAGESVRDFESSLEHAAATESRAVILDLTDLDYLDSTAVGVLVGALHRMKSENRELVLVNPRERIASLLHVARLDSLFQIFGSVPEAEAALERGEGDSGVH